LAYYHIRTYPTARPYIVTSCAGNVCGAYK
jgi:hypothetical protein